MSWQVDVQGHVFPESGEDANSAGRVIVDRGGVEWSVREVETPQPWARAPRCLVLNSRECVRRVWRYPALWREMDPEQLLALGTCD